jgi:restriction system protein
MAQHPFITESGKHGGYRQLKSYQVATTIYDATAVFCERFVDRFSRTRDQMVQAARSGKQNIVEGSVTSGTSRASEIRLVGVARASLKELLADYEDYLRQRGILQWPPDSSEAKEIRSLGYESKNSYATYAEYIEQGDGGLAANVMVCLVNQACFLLYRQLEALSARYAEQGGRREELYRRR